MNLRYLLRTPSPHAPPNSALEYREYGKWHIAVYPIKLYTNPYENDDQTITVRLRSLPHSTSFFFIILAFLFILQDKLQMQKKTGT